MHQAAIDALQRLLRDSRYRNAADAEAQARREEKISSEEEQRIYDKFEVT